MPSESPGPHIVGDVGKVLKQGWDMLLAFPPCTDLSKAGARYWPEKQADGRQAAAIEFFLSLANADIPLRCVENPAGLMSTVYRKPDQYIQPWMFGDPWIKATGLWLYGLPRLVEANAVRPVGHWVDGEGRYRDRIKAAGLRQGFRSPTKRSRTFAGIALAMADQWGG